MTNALNHALPDRRLRRVVAETPPAGGPTLLQRIEADLPNLSPQLRKVAAHLVRERGLPHRQRITDLARLSATAPVTVVRFAQRFGFKGFCELKFAFLEEDGGPLGATHAVGTGLQASEASAARQALEDAMRTIGALRRVVDHPLFMRAARWLHEADVVWVSGLLPADALAAGGLIQGLQLNGLSSVQPVSCKDARGCAVGDNSVHLQVALAAASPRAGDASATEAARAGRRIVLSRSPRPGIACEGLTLTLGIDLHKAGEALPAAIGLLAAWALAMSAIRAAAAAPAD